MLDPTVRTILTLAPAALSNVLAWVQAAAAARPNDEDLVNVLALFIHLCRCINQYLYAVLFGWVDSDPSKRQQAGPTATKQVGVSVGRSSPLGQRSRGWEVLWDMCCTPTYSCLSTCVRDVACGLHLG